MKFPIFLLHAFFFLGEKIGNPPCFKPQSWDEFGGFHEFHIPENKRISPEKCCDWKTIFPFKMFPFRGDIHSCSGKVFNESPFLSLENDIYCRDQVTISYHPGERIPSVLLFFGLNKCVDAPWPSAALLENGSSTNPLTGTSPSRSKVFMAGLIKGNQWVFV